MPDSLTRTLSRYASSLTFEELPPNVVDKIKASLLHSLVIALVGAGPSHGTASVALA